MKTNFSKTKNTLLLSIEKVGIPKLIKKIAVDKDLNIKEEFHLTIIGNDGGNVISELLKEKNLLKKQILNLRLWMNIILLGNFMKKQILFLTTQDIQLFKL